MHLVNEIHHAFENPKSLEVRAVFLDISKAFDKVWHVGFIFKLEQNGVCGNLLKFFQNYLTNRKQRVVLNSSFSDYSIIESGDPQGSVLGPLLFLIYINDLERNIKSNIKFFADDTMLFSIVYDPTISANDLNHDPDPSNQATEVFFSFTKSTANHPQLIFNGSVVAKVSNQKHLGIILDWGLSFEKLKCLSNFLPLKSLDQMYKAIVRSHLDYCDVIYHLPPLLRQAPLGVSHGKS